MSKPQLAFGSVEVIFNHRIGKKIFKIEIDQGGKARIAGNVYHNLSAAIRSITPPHKNRNGRKNR